MPYVLDQNPLFQRQLEALDNSFMPSARKAMEKIKADPYRGKALHGRWNYFEVRFDPYRITYYIDEANQKIRLLELDKRDRIFRR